MLTDEIRSSDRILEKALELFSSRGYDATSVREICQASGITKPTLYHFYGSKEGVYRALVDGTLEDFEQSLIRELKIPGTARERLQRVARGYFEKARGKRELMRFLFNLIHSPAGTAPPIDFPRFYRQVVDHIARAVEEGVAGGEFSPGSSEVRMLVFMGAIGESLCGYLLAGRPDLTASLADTIVETVLDGWSPRKSL